VRQITKRVAKSLAEFAGNDPRFGTVQTPAKPAAAARPRSYASIASATPLLPVASDRHIQLSQVTCLDGVAPIAAGRDASAANGSRDEALAFDVAEAELVD